MNNPNLILVSSNFPLPIDKDGNTINLFNFILQGNKTHDLRVIFVVKKIPENINKFIEKFGISPEFILSGGNRYGELLSRKQGNITNSTLLFTDYRAAWSFRRFKGKKIFYLADSRVRYFSGISISFYSFVQIFRYFLEETFLTLISDKIIVLSEKDKRYFLFKKNINVARLGTNINSKLIQPKQIYDLIFTGNFNYKPNLEALEYLCSKENLTKLNSSGLRLAIAGRNIPSSFFDLGRDFENLIILGEVESIHKVLLSARVYLSPIKLGSGVKNKILEAINAELAVIATSESVVGIDGQFRFSILERGTDYIDRVKSILNDPLTSEDVNFNKELLKELYSWTVIWKEDFCIHFA